MTKPIKSIQLSRFGDGSVWATTHRDEAARRPHPPLRTFRNVTPASARRVERLKKIEDSDFLGSVWYVDPRHYPLL